MAKVSIVTDSVASLPREVIDEYDIHIIPVRITVGGKSYQDTEDDLPVERIHSFQQVAQIDTTPWPPKFYLQMYTRLSQKTNKLVHIVCFSHFTATMSLAQAGARMAEDAVPGLHVEVLDSQVATMAQGFVALRAARSAASGNDIDPVVEAAREVSLQVNSVFVFDSLRCLSRTGRINRMASWASSLLKVKPVISLSRGREHPLFLARSRSQGIKKIVSVMHKEVGTGKKVHIAVMHSERGEEAKELESIIRRQFSPAELYVVPFTPVMQVVAGPGIVGVAFYCGE
ncbi:MAG: DegV family protein [Chloroflexota bacterium]|nr:DegV family protein [Chloroflexota bacterium]